MTIIAVDPGLHGAVCILQPHDLRVVDTPTFLVKATRTKAEYDLPAMWALVREWQQYPEVQVFIEAVHAMPMNGCIGNFRLGYGLGLWVAFCTSMSLSYTLVAPQRWKKVMLPDMGKDKGAARLRAMQLFPDYAQLFSRVKDADRAEAALIAEYGRRSHAST